jgi:hypothetical protein
MLSSFIIDDDDNDAIVIRLSPVYCILFHETQLRIKLKALVGRVQPQ